MKHLKLFEKFNENDPFGEEIDYLEPDGTFLTWLRINYPDENNWGFIGTIDCSGSELTSLKGIENMTELNKLICNNNLLTNLNGIENLFWLKELYCSGNKLTNLKGIGNIDIKFLFCRRNRFTKEYKNCVMNYCKNKKIHLEI